MSQVTLLDYVQEKQGKGDGLTGEDFDKCHVAMISGCQVCHSTIGPWNAYPSKTGFIRCSECIGDLGFETIKEWKEWEKDNAKSRA